MYKQIGHFFFQRVRVEAVHSIECPKIYRSTILVYLFYDREYIGHIGHNIIMHDYIIFQYNYTSVYN